MILKKLMLGTMMVGKFKVTQDSDQSLSTLYLVSFLNEKSLALVFFHMGTHNFFRPSLQNKTSLCKDIQPPMIASGIY